MPSSKLNIFSPILFKRRVLTSPLGWWVERLIVLSGIACSQSAKRTQPMSRYISPQNFLRSILCCKQKFEPLKFKACWLWSEDLLFSVSLWPTHCVPAVDGTPRNRCYLIKNKTVKLKWTFLTRLLNYPLNLLIYMFPIVAPFCNSSLWYEG